MRNFILSPNFKNSVKASFLSLVILAASLSFGCCLNASAMFNHSPHAYPSDNSSNNNPPPIASSDDKTARDEGYPSSYVFPNEDGDNNTKPTNIVDLSKYVDDKRFTNHLDFLAKCSTPVNICIAEGMAIETFPNNKKKQEDLEKKLNYFNMCVHRKRAYYEETGKGKPENFDYQKADALKYLHGEQPDNDDSCDEYWKSKCKELSPEEVEALLEFGENLQNS